MHKLKNITMKFGKTVFLFFLILFPIRMYAWIGMPTPVLHVEGRYLKDPGGNAVLLHGLAMTPNPWFNGCMHGTCRWNNYDINGCLNYMKAFINSITDTTQGWFCNLLRLHIDPYWSNNGATSGEADISKFDFNKFVNAVNNVIVPIINHAKSRGMYVILRPPGVCPDKIAVGDAYNNYLMTVWKHISKHPALKNADNVMFELANEPINILGTNGVYGQNDQVHFDALKLFFQPIVDTIRNNGANNIIWIPGTGYQSHYRGYKYNPITGGNIGYAVHIYPGYWGLNLSNTTIFNSGWDANTKPVADFAPIAITEIDWAPKSIYPTGTWGDGTTSAFGRNVKNKADATGNVSWNLLGPEDLLEKGDPNGVIAFNNDPEACANASYNWFREYSKSHVPLRIGKVSSSELLEIFPNVSTDGNLTLIHHNIPSKNCKISIYSTSGKKEYENNFLIKDNKIDIDSRLNNGIYFITVKCNQHVSSKKIIVQRK